MLALLKSLNSLPWSGWIGDGTETLGLRRIEVTRGLKRSPGANEDGKGLAGWDVAPWMDAIGIGRLHVRPMRSARDGTRQHTRQTY